MPHASPQPMHDSPSWRPRASPLARLAWVAYVVLVAYASLAPWTGWRDIGAGAFAWVTAPWPRYVTRFDLLVNILGYLPVGALGVWALHPRLRGVPAIAAAALAGVALSFGLESLQMFLPQRIASNVDLLTNSAGALLGAVLAAPLAEPLLERGRLLELRRRWFQREASLPLLLLALWPLAQAHPVPMLFGIGPGDGVALEFLRERLLPALPARGQWSATDFALAQTIVAATATLAVGLSAAACLQARAPRLRLVATLIAAALLAKALFYGIRFGADHVLAWFTGAAQTGLAVGLLALGAASVGTPKALQRVALVAVIAWLVAVAVVPTNPYFDDWVSRWRSGRMLHFHAVAEWLALTWPFALATWLVWVQPRRR
jgi:VanZ family protein